MNPMEIDTAVVVVALIVILGCCILVARDAVADACEDGDEK